MREAFEGIEWDVEETPVGSSTPDDMFEFSYKAKGNCPECGNDIDGTANYWSRDENGTDKRLNTIDYKPCEHL